MNIKTQVVIVGAGPSGLSLAAQLLRYKIDFIIIEKNENTTHLSKAVVVQARTLEIFDELGLADEAIERGQITTALNLFYQGKQKANINIAGLGKGLSPFPYALSLEQSKTEQLLVEYLSRNKTTVLWKSEFIRFEQNRDGVIAYYKDAKGQEQQIEAAYLVGCDGAGSPVRHQMGLTFEGDTVPKIFYVADVKLTSPVINKNELFIFLIEKGFVLFFPMEGTGHYRIVGILPDAKDSDVNFKFEDIEASIRKQMAVTVVFQELIWFSTYRVHSRKANAFENGRCYIAGDAAHIHTPAGGQGMNTGIQDSYNLAWKMALVLQGSLDPQILRTYSEERVQNATHLLQTTDRMFDVMTGTTGLMNFIRLHFLPFAAGLITKSALVKRQIFPLISQTGIAYPDSALTIKSSLAKVKAGDRMPYFVFSDGKQIFDYLSESCFKILFFGDEEANPSSELNAFKIKIVIYAFKEIPASIFGDHKNFFVLLRPDNHISYIGKEMNLCKDLLKKITL